MGNIDDKCSCLSEIEGNNIVILEEDQIKRSKASRSIINKGNTIQTEFMNIKNIQSGNGMVTTEKHQILENNNLDKNETKKITKLQFLVRAIHFRNKFKNIKQKLKQQTDKIIDKYTHEYKTPLVYKAENKIGPFNKEGWKKYYSNESSYLFNYDENYFGCLLKTPITLYEKSSYYIGTVNIRNQRCGYGILVNSEGGKYEGHWVNNKFTGWGRFIETDGTLWEGHFINNKLNGKGEKHCLNGDYIYGDFKNNLKHGNCREETSEHFYEGNFKLDKKEGIGSLTYKLIKDSYVGEFKDNSIIGTGVYRWANGDLFQGTFINGRMHGRGVYKWPDGGEYEGEYYDNLKEGFGVFKWSNGKIYKGSFHNGKPHGNGIMTSDKDTYDVEFLEGKLVKSVKIEKMASKIKNKNPFLSTGGNFLKSKLDKGIYKNSKTTSLSPRSNLSTITYKKTSPADSKDISISKK